MSIHINRLRTALGVTHIRRPTKEACLRFPTSPSGYSRASLLERWTW